MLGFIKKTFFTGLAFLSILTSVNLLNCISLNTQECKLRPQIVSVNSKGLVFFPLVLKLVNAVIVAITSMTFMQNCVFLIL